MNTSDLQDLLSGRKKGRKSIAERLKEAEALLMDIDKAERLAANPDFAELTAKAKFMVSRLYATMRELSLNPKKHEIELIGVACLINAYEAVIINPVANLLKRRPAAEKEHAGIMDQVKEVMDQHKE